MDFNINSFVSGAIVSEVKKLYISLLYTAEDLFNNGKIAEDDFKFLRKRILDYGNNTTRNLQEQLDNFDFVLKSKEHKDN